MDPSDYDIIRSFPSPGPSPQGLAWDGEYLWVSDDSTDIIYSINHLNGSINSSFSSPGSESRGLTYDGTYLWNIDNNARKIFKLSPDDGSVIDFLELPEEYPFTGLTWDGTYLWSAYSAGWSSSVVRIDPANGNVDSSFFCDAEGLAFDGTYLWNNKSSYGSSKGLVEKHELHHGSKIEYFRTPGYYPTGLTWDGSYLWLADSEADSLYQIDVKPTEVEESLQAPVSFVLKQNYPNPFNPSTTISFSIPEKHFVTLSVYDITGQKVATLIDKSMNAGSHSVIFDGSNLGSGVYLYKLESKGFSKTGKMLLIK